MRPDYCHFANYSISNKIELLETLEVNFSNHILIDL